MKTVTEKCEEYNKALVHYLIDYEKVLDIIDHHKMCQAIADCRINCRCIDIIKHVWDNSSAYKKIPEFKTE